MACDLDFVVLALAIQLRVDAKASCARENLQSFFKPGYHLDLTAKPRIAFFDITSHRSTPLFDLESGPAKGVAALAISPDKGTILYTQLDGSSSEIILVENFR